MEKKGNEGKTYQFTCGIEENVIDDITTEILKRNEYSLTTFTTDNHINDLPCSPGPFYDKTGNQTLLEQVGAKEDKRTTIIVHRILILNAISSANQEQRTCKRTLPFLCLHCPLPHLRLLTASSSSAPTSRCWVWRVSLRTTRRTWPI